MCLREKLIEDFPTYRDGSYRRGYCYQCHLDKKKQYYESNKEAILAHQKEYVIRNQEMISATNKRYREANRDRLIENSRLYWAAKKDEQEAKRKARYEANPELKKRKLEITLEWQRQNPDKVNARRHRRRARVNDASGSYTVEEWQALKVQYGNRCLRCDRAEPEIKLTLDHVVPLTKGGSNSIDNMQPLCRSCNSAKHTETVDYRPVPVEQAA